MQTIKSSEEISYIFNHGRRLNTAYLTVIVLAQHDQPGRVAFIAGKKLGNAVWRNRAKRRMRALYQALNYIPKDYDLVFLAKKGITEGNFEVIKNDLVKCLMKI